ncbi:MAG: PA2778 family cysteine peptidase [Pseudomonas sp.]|nr:PA2778 family cysteine peptidase [Pseudomonas sp.]
MLHLRHCAPGLPLLLTLCLGLGGCGGPTALQQSLRQMPERVELTGVPAFPERAYFGAPSALSSLLVQQGVDTSPGAVSKQLQLPEQEAQLEQNILAQVNANGLLSYPLQPHLAALLEQVAAGYPVLLRFNEGLSWIDMPLYALLIGYDRENQTLLLRAGNSRRWETSFSSFESSWASSGAWAVLVLAPLQLPAKVDSQSWLQAADELQRAGHLAAAGNARQVLQRRSGVTVQK